MDLKKSLLEIMLERIQRTDERREIVNLPVLPLRPPLPPGRRSRPVKNGRELLFLAVNLPDSIEECPIKKTCKFDADKEIEVIVGIQKWFRARQARDRYHQLKTRIITLQSFMRGEIARKYYHHLVKRQTSAVFLQCALRRHLARKTSCFVDARDIIRDVDLDSPKITGYVKVTCGDIAELERRVLTAEAELRKKNEENNLLKQQIVEFDTKWKGYDAKMTSLEKMWQDQLKSIQVILSTKGEKNGSSTNHENTAVRANVRVNTIAYFIEQSQDEVSADLHCDPESEFEKLKNKFHEWEREYRNRLRKTKAKASFHKFGKWKVKKKYKWWW